MTAPSTIWTKNGALLVDSAGRPLVCETCPCPDDCETLLSRLDALALQYQGTRYDEGVLIQRREAGDTTTIAQAAYLYNTVVEDRIALVTCGEGDECRWADLEYNLATDSYLLMPGLCRCPSMLPFYLQAFAIGAEILPEGVYCSRRNATPEDTAYGFSSATPYLAAYFNGSAWRVLRCNCAVLTLSGYDSYAFYPYPGACECFDLRRLIVENAPSFGVIDWRFGPDWIIEGGGTRRRAFYDPHYYDPGAFSCIEAAPGGFSRFTSISRFGRSTSSWITGTYQYLEIADLWTEYEPQPDLSVYGYVVLGVLVTNNSDFVLGGWDGPGAYERAVEYSQSPPDYRYMTHLRVPNSLKAKFAPLQPGQKELVRVTNRDVCTDGFTWYAKKDYYVPDIVLPFRYGIVLYAHQWICTPDGPLIRGGWNKIWSSDEVKSLYGLEFSSGGTGYDSDSEWSADLDCDSYQLPPIDCPGDDGSWKAEVP